MTGQPAVAITGLGAVTALGVGAAALDVGLRAGASGIRVRDGGASPPSVWAPLPEVEVLVEGERAGLGEDVLRRLRRVARHPSPGVRCALLAAVEAWQQAGLDRRRGDTLGLVVAGSNLANAEVAESNRRAFAGKQVRPGYAARFLDSDHVGAISEALSIFGEGYTIGGASASGGLAIAHGRRAILSGAVSAVLVVGAPMLLSPAELSALDAVGALFRQRAPDVPSRACRPFDQRAAGFVYGQGAAAVVLEPSESAFGAPARPLALLRGASMGLDGNRSTDPSVEGETRAMREALAQAGLAPDQVDFVSTHGTSSALGDRVEAAALREVFGAAGGPWLNATKALTGHCLSAAGLVGAVAAVLQLRGGYLHPNPNLEHPIDPSLGWVGAEARAHTSRVAMSNSFGFGGISSSQIFTRCQE